MSLTVYIETKDYGFAVSARLNCYFGNICYTEPVCQHNLTIPERIAHAIGAAESLLAREPERLPNSGVELRESLCTTKGLPNRFRFQVFGVDGGPLDFAQPFGKWDNKKKTGVKSGE